MLHNQYTEKSLFKEKQGLFPLLLTYGVILGLCLNYPSFLNYDTGTFKEPVTLFFGLLHGIGSSSIIKLLLGGASFFFALSFFKTILQRASSLVALLLMLTSLSIHYENQSGFDHTLILTFQFYTLICFYHFFYTPHYRRFKNLTYPNWLTILPAFLLGIHYFGSGVTKLIESGLSWADGVSLMSWVFIWSDPSQGVASLITNSYWVSLVAQITIFLIELLSFCFFIKLPRFNFFLALILCFFHIFNELLFEYGFWINIYYLGLVFLKPTLDKRREA